MTRRLTRLLPFLAAVSLVGLAYGYAAQSATTEETSVGAQFLSLSAAHHGGTMQTAIFYPATTGPGELMGDNGVFHGTPVQEGAAPMPGEHPVVLLSHGWGGNYKRMGWLSAGLVEKGAIVIAVNHPNSTTGETGNAAALNHWTRAQDLSAALDHALADPALAQLIDPNRIHAAGFSYGGWTALALGGLTGSRDGLDRFCNDGSVAISHCADILRAGIRIADIDQTQWDARHKDDRIASVAAIDPALTWGLTAGDAAMLDVPALLIALGDTASRLHATDTSETGSGFNALIRAAAPATRIETIAPATHFTALGRCKPDGAAILKSENDDPVCTDPAGTDRAAVMAQIVDLLAVHFGL